MDSVIRLFGFLLLGFGARGSFVAVYMLLQGKTPEMSTFRKIEYAAFATGMVLIALSQS